MKKNRHYQTEFRSTLRQRKVLNCDKIGETFFLDKFNQILKIARVAVFVAKLEIFFVQFYLIKGAYNVAAT